MASGKRPRRASAFSTPAASTALDAASSSRDWAGLPVRALRRVLAHACPPALAHRPASSAVGLGYRLGGAAPVPAWAAPRPPGADDGGCADGLAPIHDGMRAMRAVCRAWCRVVGDAVRGVSLQGQASLTLRLSSFPHVAHLCLGACPALHLAAPALPNGGAPASPASQPAATACGANQEVNRGAANQEPRTSSVAPGAGTPSASLPAVASLAGLTALRSLHVRHTPAHLDLAATCSSLEELVVSAHEARPRIQEPVPGWADVAGEPQPLVPPADPARLCASLRASPQLRRLQMCGIDATSTEVAEALANLTTVTSLWLHRCALAPVRWGGALAAQLQELSFRGYALGTLPVGALEALQQLRRLDVSMCALKHLPACVTKLEQLEVLYMHGNFLTRLPSGLGSLRRLADLDAYGNRLRRLPATFGELTGLTRLLLGGCSADFAAILEFPLSILHNFIRLRVLGLSGVAMEERTIDGDGDFTKGLADALGPALAGQLVELRLDQCYASDYNTSSRALHWPSLAQFVQLEKLSFGGSALLAGRLSAGVSQLSWPQYYAGRRPVWSRLTAPPELFLLSRLRELELQSSDMKVLGQDVSRLTALEVLNLMGGCDFTDDDTVTPWAAVYGLPRLRKLVATATHFRPPLAPGISALSTLEVLHLAYFDVGSAVLDEVCVGLTQLESLNLSHTVTATALPDSISRLQRLRLLHLEHSSLQRLPPAVGELTRLRSLALRA